MTASEALAALRVKPQTLYASVSRGRIAARPDPKDPRRSLYNAADVKKLAAKPRGAPRGQTVATQSLAWGEPVLSTGISTVESGRLVYRGADAAGLAQEGGLKRRPPCCGAPRGRSNSAPMARLSQAAPLGDGCSRRWPFARLRTRPASAARRPCCGATPPRWPERCCRRLPGLAKAPRTSAWPKPGVCPPIRSGAPWCCWLSLCCSLRLLPRGWW